jgi:hypothetical protein
MSSFVLIHVFVVFISRTTSLVDDIEVLPVTDIYTDDSGEVKREKIEGVMTDFARHSVERGLREDSRMDTGRRV